MRVLDAESLKALAHPLRVEIFDALSVYGPDTASGLAERLGESSGATSYHLRQLERHGFVREVAGRGKGRERWWERVPGPVSLETHEVPPSAQASARLVGRQWERTRAAHLDDYTQRAPTDLSRDWIEAATIATINVRLTVEQLAVVTAAWHRFVLEHIDPVMHEPLPGSRPVQIHFNAFPIIDADPESALKEQS